MKPKTKDSISTICSNPLSYTLKRAPNLGEALTTSASQATFDTFLDRIKLWFGDNPTASAVFRDISKLPSIYANIYENNTLGYTDTKYDEGSMYSHAIKVGCKTSVLASYTFVSYFLDQYKTNMLESSSYSEAILALRFPENTDLEELKDSNFKIAARAANYLCEVPNRFLSIATREKQRFERDNPERKKEFWKFIFEDSKKEWWKEGTGEATVKTAISDQLGELVKYLGYTNNIREWANIADNEIALFFGSNGVINFEAKDDIYSKGFKIFLIFGWDIKTLIVFSAITVIDWTAKFTIEIINAYTLIPPTKTCQDITGTAIREYSEFSSNSAEVKLFDNQTFSHINSYLGESTASTSSIREYSEFSSNLTEVELFDNQTCSHINSYLGESTASTSSEL